MKKRLIIGVAVALVCVLAAGATLAWLTASASVTNTFTVGKIAIGLDEEHWTDNSKIYPGAVIAKDPVITVTANSEACYVYAMVNNGLNATLDGAVTLDINPAWIAIGSDDDITVYRYNSIVPLSTADQELTAVFTKVTVSDTVVTEASIVSLAGKKIEVGAYAHQSNATTIGAADAAALAHFGI